MTAKQLKVSCFLFFLLFLKIPAQVNWKTMEEVIALQKIKPKKIIIDFYTNWCVPCKLMDSNTYNHPIITKLINEDYYAVKINAEGNEAIQFQGRQFSNPKYNNSKNKEKNTQHEIPRFFNI